MLLLFILIEAYQTSAHYSAKCFVAGLYLQTKMRVRIIFRPFRACLSGETVTQASAFASACADIFRPFRPSAHFHTNGGDHPNKNGRAIQPNEPLFFTGWLKAALTTKLNKKGLTHNTESLRDAIKENGGYAPGDRFYSIFMVALMILKLGMSSFRLVINNRLTKL